MANKTQTQPPLLDKRVVDRQLARGKMSQAEYETYLKSLPDLEGACENIAERIYGAEGAGTDGAGSEG